MSHVLVSDGERVAQPRRPHAVAAPLRRLASRAWTGVSAVWGAAVGIIPHVLHHVGPFAGAALLAGASGKVLFAAVGFVAAVPFLLRLRRRFGTWLAPAIALAAFAAMFSLSSFVIGPLVTGSPGGGGGPVTTPSGSHASHHQR